MAKNNLFLIIGVVLFFLALLFGSQLGIFSLLGFTPSMNCEFFPESETAICNPNYGSTSWGSWYDFVSDQETIEMYPHIKGTKDINKWSFLLRGTYSWFDYIFTDPNLAPNRMVRVGNHYFDFENPLSVDECSMNTYPDYDYKYVNDDFDTLIVTKFLSGVNNRCYYRVNVYPLLLDYLGRECIFDSDVTIREHNGIELERKHFKMYGELKNAGDYFYCEFLNIPDTLLHEDMQTRGYGIENTQYQWTGTGITIDFKTSYYPKPNEITNQQFLIDANCVEDEIIMLLGDYYICHGGNLQLITDVIHLSEEEQQRLLNLINSLQLTVEQKNAIINNLSSTLEGQIVLISELEASISEKAEIIDQLNLNLQEQILLISQLDLTIQEQATIIQEFEFTIQEQAIIISEMNLNAQQQAQLINELQMTTQEQAIIIDNLNLNIQEQATLISELEANLQQKATLIESLQIENEQQATLISQMQLSFGEQAEIINALQNTIEDDAIIISNLDLTLDEQATLISQMQLTIDEQAQLINEMELTIQEQTQLINEMELTIQEQADLIEQLNLNIHEKATIISQLELSIQEDAQLINELQLTIDEQLVIIGELQLSLEEEQQLVSNLLITIDEQQQLIEDLKTYTPQNDFDIGSFFEENKTWLLLIIGAIIFVFIIGKK